LLIQKKRSPITFWNSTTAIAYQFLGFAIADNLLEIHNSDRLSIS
jgi:hypothetical protein